jgi:hypothetical protein
MKEYIDLQSAHITQFTTEQDGKSAWKVRQNITSKDLHELPGHLSEKDIFACLEFARKFELIAFNAGIYFQKKQHQEQIRLAAQENERLALIIDKLTKGD